VYNLLTGTMKVQFGANRSKMAHASRSHPDGNAELDPMLPAIPE
jgi:hypothetical protein